MGAAIAAIITAAGSSSRMAGQMGSIKKEYLSLPSLSKDNKPLTVLGSAVSAFVSCPQIGPIIITIPPGGENAALASLPEELRHAEPGAGESRILFVTGGPSRRSSVHNALSRLETSNASHVLIHDGARPWVSRDMIEKIIQAAIRYGAVIPALPLTETPKELDCTTNADSMEEKDRQVRFVKRHLKRAELCGAQTPQGFRFPEILRAHEKAAKKEEEARDAGKIIEYTDDAEVWGEFIGKVAVIAGDPENRKITYPEDLEYASK